jgi:signal transduction histidine kinase
MVFLTWVVLLAPFVSSFLDVALVTTIQGSPPEYWATWRLRFFSDALTLLTLVPVLIIGFTRDRTRIKPPRGKWRSLEGIALLGSLITVSVEVFLTHHASATSTVLLYVPLPFFIWAAFRYGTSGISVTVSIVALCAVIGAGEGKGPFVLEDHESTVLALQGLLGLIAVSLMFLATSLAELRRSKFVATRREERLKLALGAARMGTWDWDFEHDRYRVWALLEPLEGAPRVSSGGLVAALASIHEDDRARVRAEIEVARVRKGHVHLEFRFNGDGMRWIVIKGKAMSRAGKTSHMMGIYMDITEQRAQELQVRTLHEELTYMSRVATLGELSAALAHELSQPLTAILTNAQALQHLLRRNPESTEGIYDALEDIVSENKRAASVIQGLLKLFKRGASEPQLVDPNECVAEMLALQRANLISKHIALDTTLASGLQPVLVDRIQLQQVLLNLIGNACDAMSTTSPEKRVLQITTSQIPDGGVHITVCDSGTGIAGLDHIFEPFHTTKEFGLGVGLAISKRIVAAHGGKLWATNNVSGGATLHIELPLAEVEEAHSSFDELVGEHSHQPPSVRHGRNTIDSAYRH